MNYAVFRKPEKLMKPQHLAGSDPIRRQSKALCGSHSAKTTYIFESAKPNKKHRRNIRFERCIQMLTPQPASGGLRGRCFVVLVRALRRLPLQLLPRKPSGKPEFLRAQRIEQEQIDRDAD